MKQALLAMAVVASLSLLGCGGAVAEEKPEPLAVSEQEVVTCSASCTDGSTVSCSGTTCSATQNQGVTCDGVTTSCPPPPPPSCDPSLPRCENLQGQACWPRGTRKDCCLMDGWPSWCSCSPSAQWTCVY
jgi:hypothetical protein